MVYHNFFIVIVCLLHWDNSEILLHSQANQVLVMGLLMLQNCQLIKSIFQLQFKEAKKEDEELTKMEKVKINPIVFTTRIEKYVRLS